MTAASVSFFATCLDNLFVEIFFKGKAQRSSACVHANAQQA
jgi:hypothetical protein